MNLNNLAVRPLAKVWVIACFWLALVPAAWAAGLSDQERMAAGTWYGEFSSGAGQPLQRFINTRHEDGTFSVVARLYEKGKPATELRNSGLWGVSNGLYFTITTEIGGQRTDTKRADINHAYLIRALTADAFEYQHVQSGNMFRVTRANPATVRLPD